MLASIVTTGSSESQKVPCTVGIVQTWKTLTTSPNIYAWVWCVDLPIGSLCSLEPQQVDFHSSNACDRPSYSSHWPQVNLSNKTPCCTIHLREGRIYFGCTLATDHLKRGQTLFPLGGTIVQADNWVG